jgi:hypothetical protein
VALAAALGCRDAGPTLVLEFQGLPQEATAVAVELSADSWRFAAKDVEGGPIAIHHPEGRLRLDLDRGYLARRGDRLRLPLAVPERLQVTAIALATAGGRSLRADALATIAPGQDAVLGFTFVEPSPAADAGAGAARDGGAPEEADAVSSRPEDGPPPPDAGGAPDSLPPPPDAVEATCMLGPLRPASLSVPSNDPSLAHVGGLFGLAWLQAGGGGVLYNAVDPEGALQRPDEDVTVVVADGMAAYRTPRLATLGARFALAYGRQERPGGRTTTVLRLIAPATGATVAGPTPAAANTSTITDELGAAAASPFGMAVVSRKTGTLGGPTIARVDLFDDRANAFPVGGPDLGAAYAVGITWVPGISRFAAAALADASQGGTLAIVDSVGQIDRRTRFTGPADAPVAGAAGAAVSLAGAGEQAVVAWIDGQACAGCSSREVWLALLDGGSGRVLARTRASTGTDVPKSFPHVRWDGRSFVVIWAEYLSPTNSTVRLRRFDRQLAALGGPLDLGAGARTRPIGDVDVAVAAPNDYGVVMTLFTDRHHFRRVICTGP